MHSAMLKGCAGRFGVGLLSLTLLAPLVSAQNPEVDELTAKASAFWRGNDADVELFRRALEIAAEQRDDPATQRVLTLVSLAETHRSRGEYFEAEQLFERALRIVGTEPVDVRLRPMILSQAASLYIKLCRYAEAETLLTQALSLSVRHFGNDAPQVAAVLSNLGIVYALTNRLKDAERTLKRALSTAEAQLGTEHVDVPKILSSLAVVYVARKNWKESGALLDRAFRIQEQSLGPEHPDVATTLTARALLLLKQKDWTSAERLFRRALHIHEKAFGANDIDSAVIASWLAGSLALQGKYSEASSLFARSIATQDRVLGPVAKQSSEFLRSLEEYAEVLRKLGDASHASIEERARDIRAELTLVVSARALGTKASLGSGLR